MFSLGFQTYDSRKLTYLLNSFSPVPPWLSAIFRENFLINMVGFASCFALMKAKLIFIRSQNQGTKYKKVAFGIIAYSISTIFVTALAIYLFPHLYVINLHYVAQSFKHHILCFIAALTFLPMKAYVETVIIREPIAKSKSYSLLILNLAFSFWINLCETASTSLAFTLTIPTLVLSISAFLTGSIDYSIGAQLANSIFIILLFSPPNFMIPGCGLFISSVISPPIFTMIQNAISGLFTLALIYEFNKSSNTKPASETFYSQTSQAFSRVAHYFVPDALVKTI